MDNSQLTPEYICTHYGEEEFDDKYYGGVNPPIAATSLHVFRDVESYLNYSWEDSKGQFAYGRSGNPTVALLEKKIAALERTDGALCFGSGMAAITSAVMYCIKPGDHIISITNVYGPARRFFETTLSKWGVETEYVKGHCPSDFESAIRQNTAMFYLESPSSLTMDLQDLAAIAKIAKTHGIKTVIDNTWATPIYQQPFSLGIDIVVHTMSKYIGGHSDIIGGVLCSDSDTIKDINLTGRQTDGGILGPFEAWLCIRGLRTLPIRIKKSGENAMAVAKLLEGSPKVRKVNYPGLASYPQAELATGQMSGFTGLLSFEPYADPDRCIKFGNALKIFQTGVSWGGFESLFVMGMYKYSDEQALQFGSNRNLIRLYCGLEDTQDLIDDITNALEVL